MVHLLSQSVVSSSNVAGVKIFCNVNSIIRYRHNCSFGRDTGTSLGQLFAYHTKNTPSSVMFHRYLW